MTHDHDNLNDLDRATAARLAKLRTMPVETGQVEASLRARLGLDADVARGRSLTAWSRPLIAIAAGVLLVVSILVGLGTFDTKAVLAAPQDLAAVHEEMLRGHDGLVRVSSIAEANRVLAEGKAHVPTLPETGDVSVHSCCLMKVKGKPVAAVVIDHEGQPVTIVVADAAELRMASNTRDGFTERSHNGVNMVMRQTPARAICVMGRAPMENLKAIAAAMGI
jgi:hypothetical protein